VLPLLPALYPILDASLLPPPGEPRDRWLGEVVQVLASAGVRWLQYRNKGGSDAEVLRDAAVLCAHAPVGVELFLNDRVHLLREAGFAGVHVGQGDMPPAEARALIGESRLLGLSAHTEAQVRAGDALPVDYLAYGPVFATASKTDAEPVVGLDGLRAARELTVKPLVAIGGISAEQAAAVLDAGADMVATISGVFRRDGSPADAGNLAKDFLRCFR
jgi:thiamine-phosphate pyrophosphorylase